MCDLRLETPRFTGSTTIIPHFRLIGLGGAGLHGYILGAEVI